MSCIHVRTLLLLCSFLLSLMGEPFLCSRPLTKAGLRCVVNEDIKQHGSGVIRAGDPIIRVAAETCCISGALLGWHW